MPTRLEDQPGGVTGKLDGNYGTTRVPPAPQGRASEPPAGLLRNSGSSGLVSPSGKTCTNQGASWQGTPMPNRGGR
jgi:hypothetical protein